MIQAAMMCAAKTVNSAWRTTQTGCFLYAFAFLWVLWLLFGYRNNLLPQKAHRGLPEVRPSMETGTSGLEQTGTNATSTPTKASVAAPTTRRRPKWSGVRDICWKPQCIALADIIADGLGKTNPCEDFHSFLCGHQVESKGLLTSAMKTSVAKELQDIIKYSDASAEPTWSAADKFRAAYKSCLARENDKSQLQVAVLTALKRMGFEEWPIIKKEPAEQKNESYHDVLKKIGLRPFFGFYVRGKPRHTNRRPTITITKPTFFFVTPGPPPQNSSVADARKMKNVSEHRISDPGLVKYKEFIAGAIVLLNPGFTEEQSMLLSDDIIAFENTLARLSNRSKLKKIEVVSDNATLSPRNFTIYAALQKELDVVNVTLDDGIQVLLEYPDYYSSFLDFVSKVKNTTTIKNYAAWTYVRNFAEFEGTSLHDLYLAYKSSAALSSGKPKTNDVAALCVKQLLQPHMMQIAGASLYIKYKFNEYDSNTVKKMVSYIMSSFTNIVTGNEWMSAVTKKKVIERLSRMELVIGYPDWMLDDAAVDGFYRFIPHLGENTSYAEHMTWIQENGRKQQLVTLRPEFEGKEFEDVALFPHMYYIERTDTLVLPAAAIVPYYKRPPMPRALNFGSVGALAAFLMVNVVDRFDAFFVTGNKNWTGSNVVSEEFWDQETKRNFCEASHCLKNEECTEKKQFIGNESEARFAEYIGLRASFTALKRSIHNYTRPYLLPGTDFNTEDKIFFLYFGHLYCPFHIAKNLARSRSDDSAASESGYKH